jgi:hypothetical protein
MYDMRVDQGVVHGNSSGNGDALGLAPIGAVLQALDGGYARFLPNPPKRVCAG